MQAGDTVVDYEVLLLSLDRGEFRCRASVLEKLSGAAGDVFCAVLLSQHSEEAVAALEEETADSTCGAMRLGQLKRHKLMLDTIAERQRIIDLTIRPDEEEEERALVIECQNRLRGFAGLNVRGTAKREVQSSA